MRTSIVLRRVPLPQWGLSLVVGTTVVFAGACGGPPTEYEPLPLVAVAPVLMDDAAEMLDYVNAFPLADYKQYEVADVGRFFIDNPTDMIKQVVVAGDAWERHSVELLEEHIKPGTEVIEVGAHIGTHTVLMARLAGPWGRVYAFEPQRKIYRELHHNLALNGITNVVTLRYALGSGETRIIEMNLATPGNEGGTGVGSGGDQAELRTLDSFGFEHVSLLKIDVEHYENEVLDGSIDTIRRNRPVIVIEMMGGEDYETASGEVLESIHVTWRKLETLGYTVTPVFKHDYLALPNN
jgi:FkbM family methyltransferase